VRLVTRPSPPGHIRPFRSIPDASGEVPTDGHMAVTGIASTQKGGKLADSHLHV
jgi:hypothetical protein